MTTALVPIVQVQVQKAGSTDVQEADGVWKWTKKKRAAIKLILQGRTDVSIAEQLGIHRHTVRNWKRHPEFHAEVMTAAREYVNRKRFQRVSETGIITDQLAAQVVTRLNEIMNRGKKGKPGAVAQADINALQLFMREFREFRSHERADFGDDVKRVEGRLQIFGDDSGAVPKSTKAAQSFKQFVEQHADKLPERIITSATNAQDAILSVARELLQQTEIVNEIFEEEEAGQKDEGGKR